MKVKVIADHPGYGNFPVFSKGTAVTITGKEDSHFTHWFPAVIDGYTTFISKSFVTDGILNRDYDPTELIQKVDDELEVIEIVNAWLLARNTSGNTGWIPAESTISINNNKADCTFSEVLRVNPRIETERCILRRFTPDDAQALLAWGSDKDVLEYLVWQGVTNLEEASTSIADYHSKNPGSYAIEVKATGECIGDISLRLTPEHEKASFGFVLAKDHWGKGYMTEILTVVLDFCFNTLGLNRVEACHFLGNEGSGKIMEKCGMHLEGVSKQRLLVKGKFVDTYHYAITKDDYLN